MTPVLLMSFPLLLRGPSGWLLLASLSAFVVWAGGLAMLALGSKDYKRLAQSPPSDPTRLPTLSILVPACNEAETVERAMRSLLALDYPRMEIIAVDDRSTDETGAILDRLAEEDDRLRVLHITALPPGWLGKNHALHVASGEAEGEWLLFTDADVVFAPDALSRSVGYAAARVLDHLVVSPKCETHGFWEKLFVSYFGLMLGFRLRPWAVANPRSSAYAGFGAFNLARASAYRKFGGHCALPMEIVDDMKLGKLMKRNGFRQELADGSDLLSVRWVVGFKGVLDSLNKNAFAGFEFKWPLMLGSMAGLILMTLYPVAMLVVGSPVLRVLSLATLGIMVLGAAAMRRVSGAAAAYGLAYPLACVLFLFIIVRSVWRAYRQNGIVWRGTLYPLDELKKGVV